jgi:hypothetical protein
MSRFDELRTIEDPIMFKFWYFDTERDKITISNDMDLEEALDQVPFNHSLQVFIELRTPTPDGSKEPIAF